jgi:hypothetical protein
MIGNSCMSILFPPSLLMIMTSLPVPSVKEKVLMHASLLFQVQKLMKNEFLVGTIVQLLHHPVLLWDATAEECANNQDFRALASSLICLAYFPDFAASLTAAGLAQEVANLVESLRDGLGPFF